MRKPVVCVSAVAAAFLHVLLLAGAAHAEEGDLPWTRVDLSAVTAPAELGGGSGDGDLPWT